MAKKNSVAAKVAMGDSDPADYLPSRKGRSRKATTAHETKRRFNKATVKVKTTGKKKHKTAKIKM